MSADLASLVDLRDELLGHQVAPSSGGAMKCFDRVWCWVWHHDRAGGLRRRRFGNDDIDGGTIGQFYGLHRLEGAAPPLIGCLEYPHNACPPHRSIPSSLVLMSDRCS